MRYTIGIDFGTESGRAVIVDVATGAELGTAVHVYANGVIDRHLPAPDDAVWLGPDWALQDPDDYIATIAATIPRLLATTGIDPSDVIGIGVDFTACTMLPTTADGTPLCKLDAFRGAARVGQALEAPRGATGGRPDQRGRGGPGRGLAGTLRRPDLVRMVLREGPPDPGRGSGRLRGRRPPDRGGRLDRLAADRGRDAERVHGRVQGDLVARRRLPRRGVLRRARSAPRVDRRRQDVTGSRRSEDAPVASRRKRRPGPAFGRARLSRSPTSTPTCPSRPSACTAPAPWSR